MFGWSDLRGRLFFLVCDPEAFVSISTSVTHLPACYSVCVMGNATTLHTYGV